MAAPHSEPKCAMEDVVMETIDTDIGSGDVALEFLTMNARQGAFHWVGPAAVNADTSSRTPMDGGIVFDCGTMWGGGRRLDKSIEFLVDRLARRQLALLAVSHYHADHFSKVKNLLRRIDDAGIPLPAVWLPEIDPHSMQIYLRILAFGALLRRGKSRKLSDTFLEKLFGRQQSVAETLLAVFPNLNIQTANRHTKGISTSHWAASPLSPPSFPSAPGHPLCHSLAAMQFMIRNEEVSQAIQHAIDSVLYSRTRSRGLDRHMSAAFPEAGSQELQELVSKTLLDVLTQTPGDREEHGAILALQAFLAFSAFTPATASGTRADVTGRVSPYLPTGFRHYAGRWDEVMREATHLFNLAIVVESSSSTVLLTGDADPLLYPLLIGRGRVSSKSSRQDRTVIIASPIESALGFRLVFAHDVVPVLLQEENTKGTLSSSFWLEPIKPDVVQVPHHGSEKNVVWDAYRMWQAKKVVVSAAPFGKWRHPSLELVATLVGTAVANAPRLYCTNYNSNSPVCQRGNCGLVGTEIDALLVSGSNVQWLTGRASQPAVECPHV